MAHCHNCGEEIQGGMKFCPHCGQDQSIVVPQDQRIPTEDVPVPRPLFGSQQGDSQQGSGLPRKWRIGLLGCGGLGLLELALVVVAIVSGSPNETAQSGGGGEEEGEEEKKAESKKSKKGGGSGNVEAAVGETVELDDRTLTVAEAERNYTPRDRFSKTEQGNEFLRVWVMLTNTSNRPFGYGQFDFEVQDSNGVQKRADFISDLPYKLESGDLAPGGNVEGNLVFQVPRNDNNLRLVYTSNMFSGQTVTVGPL